MKKKLLCMALAAALLLAGCGAGNGTETTASAGETLPAGDYTEGTVHGVRFTWGGTADKADPEAVAWQDEINAAYTARTGNQRVNEAYSYDLKLMFAEVEDDNLPTIFVVPNDEAQKLIENGFSRDIQALLDERDWDQSAWNSAYTADLRDENGHLNGIPYQVKARGLLCKKALFREAGLINDAGEITYPTSWDEVLDMAQVIREKTSAGGYAMDLYDRQGGKDFVNLAWNYGAEPCLNGDTANLDTAEMRSALSFYSTLGNSGVLKINPCMTSESYLVQTVLYGESAMALTSGEFPEDYTGDPDDFALVPVPEGPTGNAIVTNAYSYWFSPKATDDQVRAALDFLEMYGTAPVWNEDQQATVRRDAEEQVRTLGMYLPTVSVFTGQRRTQELTVQAEYDDKIADGYRPYVEACREEDRLRQEASPMSRDMYNLLLTILQEICTDPNKDMDGMLVQAQSDYQAILEMNP